MGTSENMEIRVFLVRPAVGLKTWKFKAFLEPPTLQFTDSQGRRREQRRSPFSVLPKIKCHEVTDSLHIAEVWLQARTPSWSSETLEIHWKTKGKPACAPGLSQAPWRFPAIGNSTPRRRCIAMRGAHANSPDPHSGTPQFTAPDARKAVRKQCTLPEPQ